MSNPVYMMYQIRVNEAWYQLSEKERNDALDKIDAINQQLRVETLIVCESGWSNDEWQFFGVEKHQSLETLQEVYKQLDGIQWSRYFTIKSILGTPWSRS